MPTRHRFRCRQKTYPATSITPAAAKSASKGFLLYAQLPGDPAKRAASLDIAHIFRKDHGFPDNPNGPTLNYQYLVIELLGKSRGHGN